MTTILFFLPFQEFIADVENGDASEG